MAKGYYWVNKDNSYPSFNKQKASLEFKEVNLNSELDKWLKKQKESRAETVHWLAKQELNFILDYCQESSDLTKVMVINEVIYEIKRLAYERFKEE